MNLPDKKIPDQTLPVVAAEIISLAFVAWQLKSRYSKRHRESQEAEMDSDPPLAEYDDDTTIFVRPEQKGRISNLTVTMLGENGQALVSATDSETENPAQPRLVVEEETLTGDVDRLTVLRDKLAVAVEKWRNKSSEEQG